MAFELGCEGMAQVQQTISEIYALYLRAFPTGPPSEATLPSTEVGVAASVGVYAPAHTQATNKIASEVEYRAKLSAYQEQDLKVQNISIMDCITMRSCCFCRISTASDFQTSWIECHA